MNNPGPTFSRQTLRLAVVGLFLGLWSAAAETGPTAGAVRPGWASTPPPTVSWNQAAAAAAAIGLMLVTAGIARSYHRR